MVKKIDAESVAREDMPSYKDRSLMSRIKTYIDDSHDPKKLPEMMRRKTAAETDAGKGEGTLQKLRSPYQSGADTEYNKRNDATRDKYNASLNVKPSVKVDTRDMDYGNRPNDVPDAVIKKTEIVKTAPVASRKTTPSAPVRKASTSGMGGIDRAALEEFRNSYDKEQRPQLDALREYTDNIKFRDAADTENARTKTEATEDLPANGMKKGGMTKRPPKPAKKVPPRKFASGGNVSRTSASKRGDGCATKGHTKGKYC